MRRRRALLGASLASVLLLGACGGSGTSDDAAQDPTTSADADATDGTTGSDDLSGELTVFAAASLNVVFEEIADLFAAEHPGTEVAFSFAGSADLVAQLDAGAPADALATANESTMASAVEAGNIDGEPDVFAANVLTLVTPAGNPAGVTGLDESLDDAALVTCAPQVPCGEATHTLSGLLGVTLSPVSEEGSVTDVLGKVTSGQGDAGLVYATDAASAGAAVDVIAVDRADEVVNRYPVAVTAGTDQPELAAAWAEFLGGAEAQQVLGEAGFGAP
ncbi:molybdate ABC transporter substrate-binding protein [Georgenia sp. MJ173]|uniref:molybdate ABC transporter substrate-binding protein n=1 Tax=Georgenia sunbinii TaxID=3117728 RepID=UPI002F2628B7